MTPIVIDNSVFLAWCMADEEELTATSAMRNQAGRPTVTDYQAGMDAYERGDYVTAHETWRPLAEQGDNESQYELSERFATGKGVLQDDDKAVYWFPRASEPYRAAVRECSTDAERLLKAVGEQALRRGLPASLLTVLESNGMALTALQVADAAVATYHTDALRHYRRALGRLDPLPASGRTVLAWIDRHALPRTRRIGDRKARPSIRQ